MRINHQETYLKRTTKKRGLSGLNVSSIWTLTGAALLTACAHDEFSFQESGGGATGAEAASSAKISTMLAAFAVVGISASSGSGDSGSGSGGEDQYSRAYTWQLHETEEHEDHHDDFTLEPHSEHEGSQRFLSDFDDTHDVSFSAMLSDGTVSQGVPRPQSAQASARAFPQSSPQSQRAGMAEDPGGGVVFDKDTFNYNRMLEGEYGTLYYHSGDGHWTYRPDPAKVNPLKEGEKGEEVFHVSAVASKEGDASPRRAASRELSITINGKDERSEDGRAVWSADAAKVGDVLTVTLTDHDGIPTDFGVRPRFEFFYDDDTDAGNGYTEISHDLASVTREAHVGVVHVGQAHVGSHIGVKIEYTDLNGFDHTITEYANKAAGVANHELPGSAAFDPGTPAVEAAQSFTVRMSDGNMPASVKYLWFYSDDTNAVAPTNQRRIGEEPEAKTGADRYFDTVTNLPSESADKYLGVEITYDDGAGSGEDKIVLFAAQTIVGTSLSTAEPEGPVEPPRNYGPSISPDRNKADQFTLSLKSQHTGYQTQPKTIVFGERGWLNDPQHNPNNQLLMTFENVVSRALESRAADSPGLALASNHSNLIVDRDRSPDTHFDSKYGTWRFDRLDEHSARTETEEEGVLWWTYQLGATSAQYANVSSYFANTRNVYPEYDQMFIRVSDGVDHAVVRLTVELSPNLNLARHNLTRMKHVENPETGAAPTLTPSNEQTIQTAASVYYEGTQTWGWDSLNNHFTWTREFNYGDYDTDQGDLRLVYHVRHVSSVEFATDFLTDRTFLDIPHDYLDATPELKAAAIANGWEPGDVGFTGRNAIGTSANRDPNQHTPGWTYMEGRYGNFYVKRIDDHETRIAEGRDETGVLRWYYDLGGADDEYTIIGNRNSADHPNHFAVLALGSGYYGFDIVYFQIFDDDGNKSDVRSIIVPIAGADSSIEGAINRQYYPHRAWLDSYDNIYESNFDVPASYRPESSSSASAPAPVFSDFDGPTDDSGAANYDIV